MGELDRLIRAEDEREKQKEECAVPRCRRLASARGWCRMHYQRWWHHGDPETLPPRRKPVVKLPKKEKPDCAACLRERDLSIERGLAAKKVGKVISKGMCATHYHRHYYHQRRRQPRSGNSGEGRIAAAGEGSNGGI